MTFISVIVYNEVKHKGTQLMAGCFFYLGIFNNTAAALNYGGYGDKQGFKPASKCSPVIYLHGTRHDMWAKL